MFLRKIRAPSLLAPIICLVRCLLAVTDVEAHSIGRDYAKPWMEQRGPSGDEEGRRGSHGRAHGEEPLPFSPRGLLHDCGEANLIRVFTTGRVGRLGRDRERETCQVWYILV